MSDTPNKSAVVDGATTTIINFLTWEELCSFFQKRVTEFPRTIHKMGWDGTTKDVTARCIGWTENSMAMVPGIIIGAPTSNNDLIYEMAEDQEDFWPSVRYFPDGEPLPSIVGRRSSTGTWHFFIKCSRQDLFRHLRVEGGELADVTAAAGKAKLDPAERYLIVRAIERAYGPDGGWREAADELL